MKGTITRIDDERPSRDGRHMFTRVYFNLENGRWAKTDIVRGFKNYHNWIGKIHKDYELDNLDLKDEHTVDADSKPTFMYE